MTLEIREVPGEPGLWVASDGRVLREAKLYSTTTRYLKVTLNGRCRSVHRAVCEAFHGPPPSALHQAAHSNGDPHDNRAENLRWATAGENAEDKGRHGTTRRGEQHYSTSLTEDDVRSIRRRAALGERQCDLADEFKLSRPGINNLIHGRSWAHVR
ncbi:HNH endonuclease [Streptomyces sp. ITFR-6]|uniref:HNH endonuclease n=1 Tax=Streptomyces sp. ITFR-6 TaxID=3075197 RepID=UPI0037DA3B25